jgi:hypothetical protein
MRHQPTTLPHVIGYQLSSNAMDIDVPSTLERQATNTSSFIVSQANTQLPNAPETVNETSKTPQKEMDQSDWSIQMFQDRPEYLNSNDDANSFLQIQKPMIDQSNTTNQLSKSHLDNPGDLSGSEFDLSDSDNASQSSDEPITTRRRTMSMVIDESNDEMYHIFNNRDVSFESNTTLVNSPSTVDNITQEQLFTLKCNSKKRTYVPGIPYTIFKTATKSKDAQLEPAPVIGPDGKATHLYFEVASWHTVMNELTHKSRRFHEEEIAKLLDTGMTLFQIQNSGYTCQGITLQIGEFWYSLACLYGKSINVTTSGFSKRDGIQWKCRGCMRHHNTLQVCLRRTFDVETALQYKANNLIGNNEWSTNVSQDVAYSLVLRVLKNLGFIHIRNQDDIDMILTPLSKEEQDEHLAWILANTHYGFRTGVELVLLCEAGMNMISFDRTDSNKKIDEIDQTIVADSWGFNRLSNVLSEVQTDRVLALLLSGDYADGNAAFSRRNSDVQDPPRLSDEWEASIEQKWRDTPNGWNNAINRGKTVGLNIWNWTLSEFQRFCRLNANVNGNLVCETSGCELTPKTFGIDRVINGIVKGVSGEYENDQIIITHQRLNDFKESGGRKIFKDVETLEMEKSRLNIIEQDHRLSTILILRSYLDPIRTFRSSQSFRNNMVRLAASK